MRYRITKLFIGGVLEGLEHTDEVSFEPPPPGTEVRWPCAGSPYRIVAVERVA